MHTIDHPASRTYYIGHTDGSVVTYGYCDPTNRVDCPSDVFETFTQEVPYKERLTALGVVIDAPEIDLAQMAPAMARIILRGKVNAIRAEKLGMPVMFDGHPYDSDSEAIGNLNGMLAAVGAGLPIPEGFTWRAADNENVPMDAMKLRMLAGAMMAYRAACYQHSWALKAQIDAADVPAAINVYNGWPQ